MRTTYTSKDCLKKMFDEYDSNIFERKPKDFKDFVDSFLEYFYPQEYYVCLENRKCDCSNPYHESFVTNSKEQAFEWYLKDPTTRKVEKREMIE